MEAVGTNISLVSFNELEQLRAISVQTFTETFAELNTEENMEKYLNENLSMEKLTQELNTRGSEFYFAKINNTIVGYLKINEGQSQTELRTNQSLEIERIYVLKIYYGKNIGKLLFDKAVSLAKERHCKFIWLGVWEENKRAIAFYKKQGFIEFDKHIFKLGDDIQNDLLMKLIF